MLRAVGSQQTPRFGPGWESVLAAAQVGSGWAFTRLFEAFAGPVAGYLRSQGAADHEGAANEVFLRAFRDIAAFRGTEEKFRAWLFTIAHHLIIDERRRSSRRPVETELSDGAERSSPVAPAAEAVALEELGSERVRAVLATLVPDQRDVLLLRILADMTCVEVAAALGKSPGAVRQLQRRALQSLRRELSTEAIPL